MLVICATFAYSFLKYTKKLLSSKDESGIQMMCVVTLCDAMYIQQKNLRRYEQSP